MPVEEPEEPLTRPTVLVLTMARDEGPLLRRWVDHYARHVGLESLLVLDDNSADGSTDDLGCTVFRLPPLPGRAGFEDARMTLVSGFARGMLATYDWVVFVDVDELLVPDPTRYADLPDLLMHRRDRPIVGAVGLNVLQLPQAEGPLDPARPVLEQRSYAVFAPLMCKPVAKRVGAPWRFSSHGIARPYRVDPDLYLLHLKFADVDTLRRIAGARHAAHQHDGRAAKSSWSKPADELVAAVERAAARVDPAAVAEFDVARADLEGAVFEEDGVHRTTRQGQLAALRENRVMRIPALLKGAV